MKNSNYALVRPATAEEIANYKAVDKWMLTLDDDTAERYTENICDFICSFGKERKKNYNKVYRIAKRAKVTIQALEDWYCVDF